MAIRNVRIDGDEVLRKNSRDVTKFNKRLETLLEDMADTMYESNGVGLAAPQIGILKKVVVIDVGEGLIELINPEVIHREGEQEEAEGCLSVPGVYGIVKRPEKVKVKAVDKNGNDFEIEGEGLLAIALSHEIDHLHGILFKDKVIRFIEQEEINRDNQSGDEVAIEK